eukprot:m51a1_g2207 hypothetical protein (516) ;mRNA; r:176843-178979
MHHGTLDAFVLMGVILCTVAAAVPACRRCGPASRGDPGATVALDREYAQLLEPPALPWRYRQVRLLLWAPAGDPRNAAALVSFYADRQGVPDTAPAYSAVLSAATAAAADGSSGVPAWHAVNVSFVASAPRVWVGVAPAGPALLLLSASSASSAPLLQRPNASSAWGPSSSGAANVTSLDVGFSGAAVRASDPPAEWSCEPERFADGGACDCGCGAWDPDCHSNASGPVSADCAGAGAVCGPAGRCTVPGWEPERCDLRHFGAFDGCHCGCGGIADPDCLLNETPVNCAGLVLPVCSSASVCSDAWTCKPELYGDGVCNCGCGVPDPDCGQVPLTASQCPASMVCVNRLCSAAPADSRKLSNTVIIAITTTLGGLSVLGLIAAVVGGMLREQAKDELSKGVFEEVPKMEAKEAGEAEEKQAVFTDSSDGDPGISLFDEAGISQNELSATESSYASDWLTPQLPSRNNTPSVLPPLALSRASVEVNRMRSSSFSSFELSRFSCDRERFFWEDSERQ